MLHLIWKHGRLVNFILCKYNLYSFISPLSAFGTNDHNAWKGNSFCDCRCLHLSHPFPAYVAFKNGKSGSASQRNDYFSEVGWQVSLQINILSMHIYGLESQVLTL